MATADQYISTAAKYIGVSGTDNIFNTWYWGRHVYDGYTYPWCAAFQSYVGVHDLKMPFKSSASAAGVANQGTRVPDSEVRKGDWVLFNWDGRQTWGWADHIGLVEWFDHNTGYFGTIEGNTGTVSGGAVARCTRYNYGNYATSFWRPPYTGSSTKPEPAKKPSKNVKFRVRQHKEWQREGFAGKQGSPITGLALEIPGWYQVCTESYGWLERVSGYNVNDHENGYAGWNDDPIIAVRAYYDTPNPSETGYFAIQYRVSDINKNFWPYQIDDDVSSDMDGYAGDMHRIDRFEASLIEC